VTTKRSFIDRNGHLFHYVLDYMRDQKSFLALNVRKESVMAELDYYGFANISSEVIDQQKAHNLALEHVEATKKSFQETLAYLRDNVEKIEIDWLLTKVATMVYDTQLRSTNSFIIRDDDLKPISLSVLSLWKDRHHLQTLVNLILSEYGLSVTAIRSDKSSKVLDTLYISFKLQKHH
jgi:hypothetical protein